MKKRRHQVVFVAYGQEVDLWRRYILLLREDPALAGSFELTLWPDENQTPRKRRLRDWLSPVERSAERLSRYLGKEPFVDHDPNTDPDITLIGMRRGCCVIQAYILRSLIEDETVRYLRRIRQVVFANPSRVRRFRTLVGVALLVTIMAPFLQMLNHLSPNTILVEPSLITMSLLLAIFSLLFGIISNPSAMDLLGLKPIRIDRDDLDRQFKERALEGNKHKPGTWPIPHQELSIQDFGEDEGAEVARIVHAILQPSGHKNVYEIDLLERRLIISPSSETKPPKEIDIPTVDNATTFVHRVSFSASNVTSEESVIPLWELRYQSYGGKIQVHGIPDTNRWTPQERSAYQNNHNRYVYRFTPEASRTYALNATLWNGYSSGNRDSHLHLRADANFRRILGVLDLRDYLVAPWRVTRPPEAYFFFGRIPRTRGKDRDLEGPSCDCIKSNRVLEEGIPIEVRAIEPGLYEWRVEQVRDGGVLGFIFDVSSAKES